MFFQNLFSWGNSKQWNTWLSYPNHHGFFLCISQKSKVYVNRPYNIDKKKHQEGNKTYQSRSNWYYATGNILSNSEKPTSKQTTFWTSIIK